MCFKSRAAPSQQCHDQLVADLRVIQQIADRVSSTDALRSLMAIRDAIAVALLRAGYEED